MAIEDGYVIILLDGEEPSESCCERYRKNARMVIATDGAANFAIEHGIDLDLIIGDMDSITKDVRKHYEEMGVKVIEEGEQYSNDFEKALRYVLTQTEYKDIIVLGIHGKRTDHLFTNFSVMLRYADEFDSLIACDRTHEHHFLTEDKHWFSFTSPVGTPISITPLPEAEGVNTVGLYYTIKKMKMVFGKNEGLSNIITEENATVEISRGALLISIPIAE